MNWHTETMEKMKARSIDSLLYIRKDAFDAAVAGETINNPKTGQYWDEYHYASMELKKRGKTI
tara:strand:- start:2311 stop:2499 length:189 start_codon:yes stop_codon:yes gene_type:complete